MNDTIYMDNRHRVVVEPVIQEAALSDMQTLKFWEARLLGKVLYRSHSGVVMEAFLVGWLSCAGMKEKQIARRIRILKRKAHHAFRQAMPLRNRLGVRPNPGRFW